MCVNIHKHLKTFLSESILNCKSNFDKFKCIYFFFKSNKSLSNFSSASLRPGGCLTSGELLRHKCSFPGIPPKASPRSQGRCFPVIG